MKPLHQQILQFLGLKSFVAALMLASPTVQAQSVKLTAPANSASDVSTQPTLAWEGKLPSKSVLTGYQYGLREGSTLGPLVISPDQTMTLQTSAVTPALKPGTKYYWKVGMFYKKANKQYIKYSSSRSFMTLPYVIETAPADGTVSTGPKLLLSWNEVPNVKYYWVEHKKNNETKNPIRRSSSQNYYEYSTAKKGVSYSWRVRAVDKNGALIGVSDWKTFSS